MSGLALKLTAMVTMLIDHIGYAFGDLMPEPLGLVCRMVGRVAMPLFCFLLAEGLFHTKNVQKYAGRLLIFAFVSEIPFDLFCSGGTTFFDFSSQNVYFTLFLALLGILTFDRMLYLNQRLLALLAILASAGLALLISADYGAFGVLFVFVFYRFRGNRRATAWSFVLTVFLLACYQVVTLMPTRGRDAAVQWALVGLFQLLALFPISLYTGKRGYGGRAAQIGFYLFYPVHLLLLAAMRVLMT